MNSALVHSLLSSRFAILTTTDLKLIALRYRKTGNLTLLSTIETLHQTDLLRNRQSDGMFNPTPLNN